MKTAELQKRTKQFNINLVRLCNDLPKTTVGFEIAKQLVQLVTASGSADFINKPAIVLEEAEELHYWLDIINCMPLLQNEVLNRLIKEADELTAIFAAANKTLRTKNK